RRVDGVVRGGGGAHRDRGACGDAAGAGVGGGDALAAGRLQRDAAAEGVRPRIAADEGVVAGQDGLAGGAGGGGRAGGAGGGGAVRVRPRALPAVALAGAVSAYWEAEAALTVTGPLVPVVLPVTVSVAETS